MRTGVTVSAAVIGGLVAASLGAQSFEERRAAIRARLRGEPPPASAAAPAPADPVDPASDPGFWRITRYHIPPARNLMGFDLSGRKPLAENELEARFYAEVEASRLPPGTDVGTPVYFYEAVGGGAHLAGRGVVRKLREEARSRVVEARILSFRHARMRPHKSRTLLGKFPSGKRAIQLDEGRRPADERWYMSTQLRGPDVQGWTLENLEAFALGNAWMGMSEAALLALLGAPRQRLAVPSEAVLIYGTGDAVERYTVRDQTVTNIATGRY